MTKAAFERWSPDTVARAEETRCWLDSETAAGRPDGEDEVWAYVTGRWPSIPTGQAERVLNLAMDARSVAHAGSSTLRPALKEAFASVCDGTMGSDDPKEWSLEASPYYPGGTVDGLIEHLAESLEKAFRAKPR